MVMPDELRPTGELEALYRKKEAEKRELVDHYESMLEAAHEEIGRLSMELKAATAQLAELIHDREFEI